mmetsp:Transcript_21671/g.69993  ORF Transcript_21671/g.69993 Transcript_21671/m.69993 type:complete len:200 (+) Transcript_21671:577-1176(+)|eukprot:scaffold25857_cov101-Isochrysis_galbana.AAC.2
MRGQGRQVSYGCGHLPSKRRCRRRRWGDGWRGRHPRENGRGQVEPSAATATNGFRPAASIVPTLRTERQIAAVRVQHKRGRVSAHRHTTVTAVYDAANSTNCAVTLRLVVLQQRLSIGARLQLKEPDRRVASGDDRARQANTFADALMLPLQLPATVHLLQVTLHRLIRAVVLRDSSGTGTFVDLRGALAAQAPPLRSL